MNKLTDENIQEIYESAVKVAANDDGNMWDFAVLTDEITNDNPCMMIIQLIDRLRDAEREEEIFSARVAELERRLQVPVVLPTRYTSSAQQVTYLYLKHEEVIRAIEKAGFKVEE